MKIFIKLSKEYVCPNFNNKNKITGRALSKVSKLLHQGLSHLIRWHSRTGNFQWRRKTVDGWQSLRPIWADGVITPNVAWLAWDHRAGYRPSSPQPAPEVNRKQSQHWELAEDWPSQLRAERTWPLAPHRHSQETGGGHGRWTLWGRELWTGLLRSPQEGCDEPDRRTKKDRDWYREKQMTDLFYCRVLSQDRNGDIKRWKPWELLSYSPQGVGAGHKHSLPHQSMTLTHPTLREKASALPGSTWLGSGWTLGNRIPFFYLPHGVSKAIEREHGWKSF